MRIAFILFAASDILLMGLTATLGFTVVGDAGFARHFLLGLLTALFTCFVHVVTFMSFVVREKIIRQAVLSAQISPEFLAEAVRLKSRALRGSALGIVCIVVVVALAGAMDARLAAAIHRDAALTTIAITAGIFVYQYRLIVRAGRQFSAAFPEDDGQHARA